MSSKMKIILAACALVAVGLMLVFNRAEESKAVVPNSVKLPAGTAIVSGDPWSGYAYFRDENFLKGSGVNYKYVEELDQAKRANMMTEGKINFLVTTMDQVLKNKPAGKIIGMIDESKGADALVLNTKKHSYLTTVDFLPRLKDEMRKQGKKPVLAYTGDSPSDFLLQKLSNTHEELRKTDFELKSVDQSATAYKMLQDGTADVAIIWEPDTSAATHDGYTVALSSRDVPNSVLDVVVASDYVIANQPQLVQQVLDEMYRMRKKAQADPQWFAGFIADDAKKAGSPLTPEQVASVLSGIHLFDAQEADRYLNQSVAPLDETPGFEALETIASLLNLSDSSIQPDKQLIDGHFAASSAQKLR
jgi:ABC-type nitrate/sulfonate/bicarbonate transport system substrate-binding protein